jgi:glycerol-3-phosphate acyltransferase PlsY
VYDAVVTESLLSLLVGYLIGSLPLGYLLASSVSGLDLRRVGSGNVGAANAYRTIGLPVALWVAAADIAKGAGAIAVASRLPVAADTVAGLGAIVGHVFPVWLRFRGGKGVATACGVFGMLAPASTLGAALVFVLVVSVTRYVSVASMFASLALPPIAWFAGSSPAVIGAAGVAAALIVISHRSNLVRVYHGSEHRLGERRAPLR